jgi:hypothetical protein
MTTKGSIPVDDSYKPVVGLWDDSGHQVVGARAKNVGTDSTTGDKYGDLGVNVEVSIAPTAIQRVNAQSGDFLSGAFADGAITTLGLEADSAVTNPASSGTLIALIKGVLTAVNKLIAPSINSGTVDATTQRTVPGGAATGTKSNVGSSGSSVTILASNTSRKGAMVYNDSTQILYLDLSGGTASNSSYSVQVGSQGFFELPGPTIYNGAITGIWASANGNARVTEFS